MTAISLGGQNR